LGFFYKISDLFGDYEFSSLDFMLYVPALLAYGKARSLKTPAWEAQRPNSVKPLEADPWSCPDCQFYNSHMLCVGICSKCGYVRDDPELRPYDAKKVHGALRLFKKWVGIIAPHHRLGSKQLRALEPPVKSRNTRSSSLGRKTDLQSQFTEEMDDAGIEEPSEPYLQPMSDNFPGLCYVSELDFNLFILETIGSSAETFAEEEGS
jgi:hypothetical protein